MKTPFPYQLEGAAWLAGKQRGLLADEMGIGKTMQAVLAADAVGAKRIVVVCPAIARPTWRREFSEWQKIPRPVRVLEALTDDPDAEGVSVASYEYATQDVFGRLSRDKDLLIIDEAHWLANWNAQRTRAVLGAEGARKGAARVWCLSGTPMRRSDPTALWPMLYSLAPETITGGDGKPMGLVAFRTRYCKGYMYRHNFIVAGVKNAEELAARIAPFMLRRRASDVLKDLPAIHFFDLELDISPKNLPGFLTTEGDDEEMIRRVKGLGDQASWREKLGAVKAVECGRLVKAELLAGAYDKIVLFAWHSSALDTLGKLLAEFNPARVSGGISTREKEAAEARFQGDPHCRVFLGNINAAGVNLTLTAAHHVLFVECDWLPVNNAQAALRTRRIGQRHVSMVRFATTQDPMDKRVTAALRRQTAEVASVLGASMETEMQNRRLA